jgi:hypothetical protein
LCALPIYPVRATCSVNLILPDVITLITFGYFSPLHHDSCSRWSGSRATAY